MSEFWNKFKGVFVEEVPTDKSAAKLAPQASATNAPTAQNTPSVSQSQNVPQTQMTVGGGAVNEKFMQVLAGAMEGANQEGFDYLEYRQAIFNLKNVPMDEATRFKSAYAMAQSMGVTVDKLLNSANHYLTVLKTEETKFLQAAENQRAAQIGNKQGQADNLDLVIKQKAEQIKKLTAEIEAHQKEITAIKDDIAQSTVKVQQTVGDFKASYAALVTQIQSDVSQIQMYLK